MSQPDFELTRIVSALFEENAFVVRLRDRADAVVIDPGLEPEKIIDHLDAQDIRPAAILLTHGHCDHIAGIAALKERWGDCPVVVGRQDADKLTDAAKNLSADFGLPLCFAPADATVEEGDVYSAAGIGWRVRHVPGHSAGHVVYLWDEPRPMIVMVGDVIFAGGIGRTDFADGDFDLLIRGIREKLFTLPDDAILWPGHGPATTVGREKRTNPFVGQRAGET
ncbi:MAG: MBL fold metallo-hydrolase [Pirellulales bacterium]|nr:MBL fold metallo-hydrolase [Pirellulales bacterium]